jgi:hypothetical protein
MPDIWASKSLAPNVQWSSINFIRITFEYVAEKNVKLYWMYCIKTVMCIPSKDDD